jgi:hypothetical protein
MTSRGFQSIEIVALALTLAMAAACSGPRSGSTDSTARIRRDLKTGFSNGGWNLDRYPELEPLKAGRRITIADLPGPGIIRHIHTTRHNPAEVFARGIVMEIWFDGEASPAVMSPLADFFGDGANGRSMDFSAGLLECAPWSYNSYFAMPFKTRARVCLRNDTERDAFNYSYVEWEKLPKWDSQYGYFHATYARKTFRLLEATNELFFEVKGGAGQLLGRQFSVITDDPAFEGFYYVMEGNNEVAIDGKARTMDYLGSEDSFTFSWGFNKTFAGLHAGMTLVEPGGKGRPSCLSIYRFHDHMPIRFRESLDWRINWGYEKQMHDSREFREGPAKASRDRGGCWVDYATVFYWYQDNPAGYRHAELEAPEARRALMLHPNPKTAPEAQPQK